MVTAHHHPEDLVTLDLARAISVGPPWADPLREEATIADHLRHGAEGITEAHPARPHENMTALLRQRRASLADRLRLEPKRNRWTEMWTCRPRDRTAVIVTVYRLLPEDSKKNTRVVDAEAEAEVHEGTVNETDETTGIDVAGTANIAETGNGRAAGGN